MEILFCSKKTAFGTEPVGGAETSMRLMAESLAGAGKRPVYLVFGIEKKGPLPKHRVLGGITLHHYSRATLGP